MVPIDILAIVAHADDAEIGCGGTLLLHARAGERTGIVDVSRGELGTRGSAEQRTVEATAAAQLLGLTVRKQLTLADGFIKDDPEARLAIIRVIRHYQPRIVLTNAPEDRHPDHGCAARLVRHAAFLAGLPKIHTKNDDDGHLQQAHRPQHVYHFVQAHYHTPTFIVDISSVWEQKMAAVAAYRSQFYQPNQDDQQPQTYISTPAFQDFLHARAKEFGFRIGAAYGEGFISPVTPGISTLNNLL